LEHIIPILTYS